jgi:hypothetical protein
MRAAIVSYNHRVAILLALVLSMAIPPPDVFINIEKARMVDKHTLEVTFDWPRCADPKSIRADWFGCSQEKTGWDIRFSLQEMRSDHGVAACTGPVEKQTRKIDLRTILRQEMDHGVLQINDASLYGYMKKLPTLTVKFDLR